MKKKNRGKRFAALILVLALGMVPCGNASAAETETVSTLSYQPLMSVMSASLTASSPEEAAQQAESALYHRVVDLTISLSPAICREAYQKVMERLNQVSVSPLAGYNLADMRSMEVSYNINMDQASVTVHYDYGSAGLENEIEAVIAEKSAEFAALPNAYEKVLAVHDYLCNTAYYCLDEYYSHTAYGALVTHYAVCDGYSLAVQRFMDVLNIPCRIALGEKNGEPHAWNLVMLDGKWYHLDVTWDDHRIGILRDNFLVGSKNAGYSQWGNITLAQEDYGR